MLIEFKQQLYRKEFYLFVILLLITMLGAFVPSPLSHKSILTYIWSWKTQFGFLIYSIVIGTIFIREKSENSLKFHLEQGRTFIKLQLIKVALLALTSLVVALIEGIILFFVTKSGWQIVSFIFLEFVVMLQFIFIIGIISLFYKNVILIFITSFAYWVASTMLGVFTNIAYFAYFDQNTKLDERIIHLFNNHQQIFGSELLPITMYISVIAIIFIITLIWKGKQNEIIKL